MYQGGHQEQPAVGRNSHEQPATSNLQELTQTGNDQNSEQKEEIQNSFENTWTSQMSL